MVGNNNEDLKETAETQFIMNSEEIAQQQRRAREDAERRERTLERNNRLLTEELAESKKVIAEKDKEILRLKEMLNTNNRKQSLQKGSVAKELKS